MKPTHYHLIHLTTDQSDGGKREDPESNLAYFDRPNGDAAAQIARVVWEKIDEQCTLAEVEERIRAIPRGTYADFEDQRVYHGCPGEEAEIERLAGERGSVFGEAPEAQAGETVGVEELDSVFLTRIKPLVDPDDFETIRGLINQNHELYAIATGYSGILDKYRVSMSEVETLLALWDGAHRIVRPTDLASTGVRMDALEVTGLLPAIESRVLLTAMKILRYQYVERIKLRQSGYLG